MEATEDEGAAVDAARRLFTGLLPALALAPAAAQDAARAQPGAYKVVFENERVRALRYDSRPGRGICGEGLHSHPAHLTIVLTAAKARIKLPDGKVFTGENQAGDVFWEDAVTHEVENIGGRNVSAILVELKDPPGATKGGKG